MNPRPSPKSTLTPPPPLTPALPKQDVNIRAESLEQSLQEKYNDEFIKLLKRLAYEIAVVGLPLNEACMIVGIDPERLKMVMLQDDLVEQMIKNKDLEYKRSLLIPLSEKAKTDERVSQWLLERRYPDEFNSRKGNAPQDQNTGDNLLSMAVEFIQKSGDNTPLVNEKSAKITIVKRTRDENKEFLKKIGSILR